MVFSMHQTQGQLMANCFLKDLTQQEKRKVHKLSKSSLISLDRMEIQLKIKDNSLRLLFKMRSH